MAVAVEPLKPISLAVTDRPPARRPLVILAALTFGIGLAVIWSFAIVDASIGDRIANGLLGYNAKETTPDRCDHGRPLRLRHRHRWYVHRVQHRRVQRHRPADGPEAVLREQAGRD